MDCSLTFSIVGLLTHSFNRGIVHSSCHMICTQCMGNFTEYHQLPKGDWRDHSIDLLSHSTEDPEVPAQWFGTLKLFCSPDNLYAVCRSTLENCVMQYNKKPFPSSRLQALCMWTVQINKNRDHKCSLEISVSYLEIYKAINKIITLHWAPLKNTCTNVLGECIGLILALSQ